eukprot:m.408374 g.408374  ORF g.408374 m.408374 type:complete len:107 (-) comp21234_c0_seq7:97-417(-)
MAEMLFCSICDIYTHIDNFSTKQAKLESNDVNGGSVFRFCLKHTSGDQRDWIAKLKHRAAREYSIVDNAERLRERQQTLASTFINTPHVRATFFLFLIAFVRRSHT